MRGPIWETILRVEQRYYSGNKDGMAAPLFGRLNHFEYSNR